MNERSGYIQEGRKSKIIVWGKKWTMAIHGGEGTGGPEKGEKSDFHTEEPTNGEGELCNSCLSTYKRQSQKFLQQDGPGGSVV